MYRIIIILLLLTFNSCKEKIKNMSIPPICEVQEKLLSKHNDNRVDNYYWLNDRNNPKVIDYLNKEMITQTSN